MKELIIKNNSSFDCEDESTLDIIKIAVINSDEGEEIIDEMTKENFSKGSFDGVNFIDRIPTSTDIIEENNEVFVIIETRAKSIEEYIIEQGQQILELQEAFAQIVG